MTTREDFEAWWKDFTDVRDDWRYADSDALRFQTWQAATAAALVRAAAGGQAMNPILYRYKDTESVIKVMDGYTPGDGWSPLYGSDEVKAATAAALERAAKVCDELAEDYLAKYLASGGTRQQTNLDYLDGASDAAEICREEIRALKDADTC